MPGPVNYVTDAITQGRLRNLDDYVKNLLAQPAHISRSNLVKQFFAPREGDYESELPIDDEEYRLSGQSHPSGESPPDPAQLSGNNLNGNGYGGLSATPRQPGGFSSDQPGPGHHQQSSSLGQPAQVSPLGQGQGTAPPMKVKFHFNGEVYAIRVPNDIAFESLLDRICERLRIPPGEEVHLSYKDEATNDRPSLLSNNDLDTALQRNEKLFLFVEQV